MKAFVALGSLAAMPGDSFRRAARIVMVLCGACILLSVTARADGVFLATAGAGVFGSASDSSINLNQYSIGNSTGAGVSGKVSGVFTVSQETDAGPNLFSFFSSGESNASASAGMGVLRVVAQAGAKSTPQSYTFSSGGQTSTVFNPGFGEGFASATALFEDTLTIVGSGAVSIRFSFAVDGGVSAGPAIGPNAALLSSTMDVAGEVIRQGSVGTLSLDNSFAPGDQVFIRATLDGTARAVAGSANNYVADAIAAANGGDTGRFFVDVLSPGGGYVAASGTIYPGGPTNVVPEPASLTLLGSGLLGLAGYIRRRRLA